MPRETKRVLERTDLIETPPDDLSSDKRLAIERAVYEVCGGAGTQRARVFRICCYNSDRIPGQLLPRYFRTIKNLETLEDATLARLRKDINKFPRPESRARRELPVFARFDRSGYRVTFHSNPDFSGSAPTVSYPSVVSNRLVTVEELLALERPKAVGGHLLLREDLIVQGRTPLLIRPEVAAVVLDNMGSGTRYQFVFPDDAVTEVALAVHALLTASPEKSTIDQNVDKIGSNLEIYLVPAVWPLVVSVHNAKNDVEAKSYLRIPDSDTLLLLCAGQEAYRIAEEIRAMVGHARSLADESWFRSPTGRAFKAGFLKELGNRLRCSVSQEMQERLFGKSFA